MMALNLPYFHCLQNSFFEHFFNLYILNCCYLFVKNVKLALSLHEHTIAYIYWCIKDATSVSLYPYNWSQILQYVKYTK